PSRQTRRGALQARPGVSLRPGLTVIVEGELSMAVKVPRYSLRLLSSTPRVRSVTPVPHSKGIEMDHEASNEQFITQAATAPSVGLSPRWVQYSGISTEARSIAELLADSVLYV